MAIIRININEVIISYGENNEKVFSSGDFVKDWYDMRKFMIQELSNTEPVFSHSSSVDHFIMDGAPYSSAYLKIDKNKNPYLSYEICDYDNGIEFFVPEGTQPTWEELKEMCELKRGFE